MATLYWKARMGIQYSMTSEVKGKLRESVVAKLLTERKLSSPHVTTSPAPPSTSTPTPPQGTATVLPPTGTPPTVATPHSTGTTARVATPQSSPASNTPTPISTPAPTPTARGTPTKIGQIEEYIIHAQAQPSDELNVGALLDLNTVRGEIAQLIAVLKSESPSAAHTSGRCAYCPFSGPTNAAILSHYQFHEQLLCGDASQSHLRWLSYWSNHPGARDQSMTSPLVMPILTQPQNRPELSGDNKHSPTLKDLLVGKQQQQQQQQQQAAAAALLARQQAALAASVVASTAAATSTSNSAAGCLRNIVEAVMSSTKQGSKPAVSSSAREPPSSIAEVYPAKSVESPPAPIDVRPESTTLDDQTIHTYRDDPGVLQHRTQELPSLSYPGSTTKESHDSTRAAAGAGRISASLLSSRSLESASSMSCSDIYRHGSYNVNIRQAFTPFSSGSCIDFSSASSQDALSQSHKLFSSVGSSDGRMSSVDDSIDAPIDMSIRTPTYIKKEPQDDFDDVGKGATSPLQKGRRSLTLSTTQLSQYGSRSSTGSRKRKYQNSSAITCSPHVMSPLKKMLLHKARSMESLNINNTRKPTVKLMSPLAETFPAHQNDVATTEELFPRLAEEHHQVSTGIRYLSPASIPTPGFERRTAPRLESHSPFRDSVSSSGISSCNSPVSEHYSEQAAAHLKNLQRSDKATQCELYKDCEPVSATACLTSADNRAVSSAGASSTDLKCQHCGVSFDDDVIYSIHMGCHSHADPFICNLCGKQCENKYCFYTHIMRGHHRPKS